MEKEKQSKLLRNKIMRMLPKAAAAVTVTFQNPPFSPGRVKPHGGGKGFFSGPMIPNEARRKPKDGGTETQEPTSPKISCMGQIKHKKKQIQSFKSKSVSVTHTRHAVVNSSASSTPRDTTTTTTEVVKKQGNRFQRMFGSRKLSNASASEFSASLGEEGNNYRAPPVGEMRRFASGREAFASFDWKAQVAPEEIEQRNCFSEAEEEDDEVLIPFSAPIGGTAGAGGASNLRNLKPRKEINLWKRRTMAPPRPLQLNPVLTAK